MQHQSFITAGSFVMTLTVLKYLSIYIPETVTAGYFQSSVLRTFVVLWTKMWWGHFLLQFSLFRNVKTSNTCMYIMTSSKQESNVLHHKVKLTRGHPLAKVLKAYEVSHLHLLYACNNDSTINYRHGITIKLHHMHSTRCDTLQLQHGQCVSVCLCFRYNGDTLNWMRCRFGYGLVGVKKTYKRGPWYSGQGASIFWGGDADWC